MFFQPMIVVVFVSLAIFAASMVFVFKTSNRAAKVRWGVRALAALLLLTAGLRPSVPTLAPSEVYNNQYDVYFVVDLTSSMIAEDGGPDGETRLDLVREDINDLLDDYVGAKFSLITFKSSPEKPTDPKEFVNSGATLRVPLTPDSTAIASSVNTMVPEITQFSNGSSISAPVSLLKQVLNSDNESNERAKLLLYFGDGEQTGKGEPETFAGLKELVGQSKVYGYGTSEGGRMKVQSGSYISSNPDEYIQYQGKDALSVLDENNLKKIANELGGSYQLRTADTTIEPAQLTNDQKLELQKTEESSINNTVEYYWVFLIMLSLVMFFESAFLVRKAKLLGVNWK